MTSIAVRREAPRRRAARAGRRAGQDRSARRPGRDRRVAALALGQARHPADAVAALVKAGRRSVELRPRGRRDRAGRRSAAPRPAEALEALGQGRGRRRSARRPPGRSGAVETLTILARSERAPFFDAPFRKGVESQRDGRRPGVRRVQRVDSHRGAAMCALRAAGRTRSAPAHSASAQPVTTPTAPPHAHGGAARARSAATHDPAELQVLPELRHSACRRRARDFDVETRVGPRQPTAATQKPGAQHAVLRRRAADRAREADADPRRRRGRRVVHARRHRSPRRSRRVPDLVPRRSVPVADPRELSLREQPAGRARRGLAQRRVTCASPAPCTIEPGTTILVGEQVLSVGAGADARGRARRRGHLLLREHAAPGDARDRPAAARRLERLGVPPQTRHASRSAARATTSTSPTTRSSRAATRRSSSPAACYPLPIWARATVRSSASPASTCSSTATTCSWASSYFASKSSERLTGATMTVCNRCGKENQDHYKFCLGCGAELTAPKAPAAATWR